MSLSSLALLALVCASTVHSFAVGVNKNRCWTDGNGDPARWFDDGTEIVRGRYWYECRAGRLEPIGCINDADERILKNDAFVADGFQYRCVMDTEGYLFFEPAACVTTDGALHQPGDTFDVVSGHNFWQKCSREYFYNRPYLSVTTEGCLVGESRRRIRINETIDMDGSWWECRNMYSSAQLCLKGCVYEGRRVDAGEQWEEGEYVYTCKKKGDKAEIECIGCMDADRERRLRSGDRYWMEDSVLQCEILYDPNSGNVTKNHRVVGCVERDERGQPVGERTLGCRWYTRAGDVKYEKTCSQDGKPLPVGCVLTKNGIDYLFVPPNTYTIHHPNNEESVYLACRVTPDGELEHFQFSETEVSDGIGTGRLRGLRYSRPMGKK